MGSKLQVRHQGIRSWAVVTLLLSRQITYTTTSKTFTTNQIGSIDESDGSQLRETDAISLTSTLSMDTRGHMPVKAKASRRRSRQR
jgi:hypothetical protein